MKKTIVLILFVSAINYVYAQHSSVNGDTIKDSKLKVQQTGGKGVQLSEINSKNIVGSEIAVIQAQDSTDIPIKEPEKSGFMQIVTDTNTIIALLSAIIALGGTVWGSIHLRKRKRKK